MKNAFYFILNAVFVLKIFKFLLTFWACRENDGLKEKVNFKLHEITTWLINNCNRHIAEYLTKQK